MPLPAGAVASELLTVVVRGSLRVSRESDVALARTTLRCFDAADTLLAEHAAGWATATAGSWTPTVHERLLPPGTSRIELALSTTAAAAVEFDEFTLSLGSTARATNFAAWQQFYFSPAELADPLVSGPEAEHPGGTPANLIKYAFRLPRSAGTPEWPRARMGTDRLGLRFLFDPGKTDLDYRVIIGPDFSNSDGPLVFSSVDGEAVPDASCHLTIEDPVPLAAASRRFGRVVILQRMATGLSN